jgi:hypothetical protein
MHTLAELIFGWLDRYPVNAGTTRERVVAAIQRKFNVTSDFASMYLDLWFVSIEARE